MRLLSNMWNYRSFILSSVKNDIVSRFARSKFGFLWMIINPLSQVAIYALILSNVLAAKLPGAASQFSYAIYLTAGLLGWSLFNEIVTRCLTLFVEQANLMKKMSFPRITLPAIVVWSSLINNGLLFVAMLVIFLLLGHPLEIGLFWIVPLIFVTSLLGLGVGLILGILNVFVRDIAQVVPIVLQVLFWFTPIVYPQSIIPEKYLPLLNVNPLVGLISSYQGVILYGKAPDLISMLTILGMALFSVIIALFMFRKSSPEMVDVL